LISGQQTPLRPIVDFILRHPACDECHTPTHHLASVQPKPKEAHQADGC
jgi:hypothetical protein